MKLFDITFALGIALMGSAAQSQPVKSTEVNRIESKYRFENDTSLVNLLQRWTIISRHEMTFNGRHELPIIPELQTIEATTFREAIAKALIAYRGYELDVVLTAWLDDAQKHLYLSSISKIEQTKPVVSKITTGAGFSVNSDDKSLMQVLVRWATQVGFSTTINEQPVNTDVFPKHPTRYFDYTLVSSAMTFKTQSPMKEAISQLLVLYTGKSLSPFQVIVDESTKQLIIVSLVK